MDDAAYLDGLQGKGISLGLDAIRRVMSRLGNPQDACPAILVAGTNGKGSVAAAIASILMASGRTVGLYTSPHLVDVRERIRCNGQDISREDFAAALDRVAAVSEDSLTYFETLTAAAWVHFARKSAQAAVLEIGMGGRLDATNIVDPVVSVITNISRDHAEYLGGRLDAIAREKAGVLREGRVTVTAATGPALQAIGEVATLRAARLQTLGRDLRLRRHRTTGTFGCSGPGWREDGLKFALQGEHQMVNAALAVGAVRALAAQGWDIPSEAISRGLKETTWPGRFDIVADTPTVVLDGAHNPAGVTALCRTLSGMFPTRRKVIVCGILADKAAAVMARRLAALADVLILTRPSSDRAMAPEALRRHVLGLCREVCVRERPEEAHEAALRLANPEDVVCVTGSLFLIGDIQGRFYSHA